MENKQQISSQIDEPELLKKALGYLEKFTT